MKHIIFALFVVAAGYFQTLPTAAAQPSESTLVRSNDGPFSYEIFSSNHAKGPNLILLHGVSGPDVALYRDQARLFADRGYTVYLPHYFEATRSTSPTVANYEAWVAVVKELISESTTQASSPKGTVLLGFSLGASIALAAGSQGLSVNAIAEWYGSLPDSFFYHLQGMPPLLILHGERDTNIPVINAQQLIKLCGLKHFTCESHIYPDQAHGFAAKELEDADTRTLAFFARYLPQ